MMIGSALFKAVPKNVIVLPVMFEGQVKAVIELASVGTFTDLQISFLEQLTSGIVIVLNSIEATMQTEGLLKQGASATAEELREWLLGQTVKFWVPERWCFITEVPKTSVGKFDKKVLRARNEQGELAVEKLA